jgi:hypothetical protein
MGDGVRHPGFDNPDLDERWRDEIQKDIRDKSAMEHLADEARPTWWMRLKRRLRPAKD